MIDRLQQQIQFIIEIDKLKGILRQTLIMDGSRNENDAEHSWHLAVMAVLFAEYATTRNLDLLKTLKMLLIHDLVEIDAGDTFCYDEKANADKAERELIAADRLFGLLPDDQAREFRALWEEFEARQTGEAVFAASLDRMHPIIHNYMTGGHAWQKHGVTSDRVYARNAIVERGAPELWEYVKHIVEDAVAKGFLPR